MAVLDGARVDPGQASILQAPTAPQFHQARHRIVHIQLRPAAHHDSPEAALLKLVSLAECGQGRGRGVRNPVGGGDPVMAGPH
jgi:hypothetical protein